MNIVVTERDVYPWTVNKRCYFRGYIQKNSGECLRGIDAIDYFFCEDYNVFLEKVKNIYGCFSVILVHDNECYLAVDVARSMPLYYDTSLSIISDNAEEIRKFLNIKTSSIDIKKAAELLTTSYIIGDHTIYSDIHQLEIGCAGRINDGTIRKNYYFRHYSKGFVDNENKAMEKLRVASNNMVMRLKYLINDRPLLVSLSGGYDSRYIVCTLKENGFSNVVCYSYGRKGSFELVQAEQVAKAVGYKWIKIEYDEEDNDLILSPEGIKYMNYCYNHEYMVYIQNFTAVKKIFDNKLVPANSIVITGLCNDMHTGLYTPSINVAAEYGFNKNGLAEFIVDKRFARYAPINSYREYLKNEVISMMEFYDLNVNDHMSFIRAYDCLDAGFSHSRCFLNMNKVHEFYGYEWALPCWDKELLDFWYSLSPDLRRSQYLYEKYITEFLGKKYGVGQKKYTNNEGRSKVSKFIRRNVGGMIVGICYPLGIPVKRKSDINNFSTLEVKLYKELSQKYVIAKRHAAFTLLLTAYLMEKRYGRQWGRDVMKIIRKT